MLAFWVRNAIGTLEPMPRRVNYSSRSVRKCWSTLEFGPFGDPLKDLVHVEVVAVPDAP